MYSFRYYTSAQMIEWVASKGCGYAARIVDRRKVTKKKKTINGFSEFRDVLIIISEGAYSKFN